MKIYFKLITILTVISFMLSYMPAFADDEDFTLGYDSSGNCFVITGVTDFSARVLLMVYAPVSGSPGLSTLYYFEGKNNVSGDYEFRVIMDGGCTEGNYIFKVSVNGQTQYSMERESNWSFDEKSLTIQSLEMDVPVAGSPISATAIITNSKSVPVKAPVVVIALYRQVAGSPKVLIDMAVSTTDWIEPLGETEIKSQIDSLPIDLAGCSVKAFIFRDLSSMEPLIDGI